MGLFGGFSRIFIRKAKNQIKNYMNTDHDGSKGEAKVDSKLNPLLFGKVDHKQLNNYIILDKDGKSHQIDHIEIRRNGIFCIETKNYKGFIYGTEEGQYWSQYLYNGEKHQMYNPVLQNKTHAYHLKKLLNDEFEIISIVVMVQNNAEKINVKNVINLADLKYFLANYNDGYSYSSGDIEYIYSVLEEKRAKMTNEEHVDNIKKRQANMLVVFWRALRDSNPRPFGS